MQPTNVQSQPAAEPSELAPAEPVGEFEIPDEVDVDLSGVVADEVGQVENVATQPASAAQTAPGGEQPPATPDAQVQPATTQPTSPEGQPATPQPAQQPDAGQPVDILAELAKHRDAIVSSLAQQHFQLSQEEVDAIAVDPGPVLSKFAARVYYMATVQALQNQKQLIEKVLPRMFEQFTTSRERDTKTTTDFFTQNPDLKGRDADIVMFAESIKRAAGAAGQTLTQEQLWERTAKAVRAYAGLAAPAAPNGSRQAPFRPAPSGVPQTRQQVVEENPFAGMGMDFDT